MADCFGSTGHKCELIAVFADIYQISVVYSLLQLQSRRILLSNSYRGCMLLLLFFNFGVFFDAESFEQIYVKRLAVLRTLSAGPRKIIDIRTYF